MKKLLIGIFAVASVITVSSCSKSDSSNSTPVTTAKVMFVNGSAGTTPVSITVNGAAVTQVSNLDYLKGSGYVNIASGTDSISFLYQSTGTLFKSDTAAFTAGNTYSVFAGGLINPATILVTNDDLSAPSSGKAKIRVVNLSSDTAHISMLVGLNTVFSGIASNQASAFTEITAGSSSTIQLGYGTNTILLTGKTFVAGKIYTIIYTGTVNGAQSVNLTATVINNN